MRNFNTNQTRHLYVAEAVDSNVDTNLDIALAQTATGEAYLKYKNAEGLITRSDTFDPKKIVSLKLTKAADMATKLMAHTITIDTDVFANAAAIASAGKTVKLTVTLRQVFDYDDNNIKVFSVTHKPAASETNANFYKALADAVTAALPGGDPSYPYLVATSSSAGLVLTEAAQKYVLGKLTGEPVPFTVSFGLVDDDEVAWGKDAIAASGNTITKANVLADLEYFAAGERGDYYRGAFWPNNYEFVPAINRAQHYNVLSIEYYWNGDAENVQKSPRLIQVAGKVTGSGSQATSPADSLYASIQALMNGNGSGSGAGA